MIMGVPAPTPVTVRVPGVPEAAVVGGPVFVPVTTGRSSHNHTTLEDSIGLRDLSGVEKLGGDNRGGEPKLTRGDLLVKALGLASLIPPLNNETPGPRIVRFHMETIWPS